MICTPAFVYLILCSIQILLDFVNGMYNTAFVKIFVTIVITFLLNLLCDLDLGFISWIIVLVPFLFMTLIVSIILYVLGYDAVTGKSIQSTPNTTPSYFQTSFTSPPIPPRFLPEVVVNDPNSPPIEEKNMYLIIFNPTQNVVHNPNNS